MSNYQVEPIDKPAALTKEAIKALRREQVQGLSRRQLIRNALGPALGCGCSKSPRARSASPGRT